jgi:hypothetical protein
MVLSFTLLGTAVTAIFVAVYYSEPYVSIVLQIIMNTLQFVGLCGVYFMIHSDRRKGYAPSSSNASLEMNNTS